MHDSEVRVVMEHTGRSWIPIAKNLHDAGLFVCSVNPKLIKDFKDTNLRNNVKIDRADSKKISRYGLTYWNRLKQYAPTEEMRQKLQEFSR
jgi:transposase